MKNIAIILTMATVLFAQTGLELAQQIDNKKEPNDISAIMKMELTNKKGKVKTSSFKSISKDGGEKQIIWFLSPADDKGVAFLKIEHENKDDEMRMWLPAFNKIRRISSKKKADAFMGSDMSYEDLENRNINENTYEIIGEEEINGVLCWMLKSTPNKGITKTYSHHITWVSKDKLLALKEESFDRTNKLLKFKTFEYQHIGEYDTPSEIFVENVQKKHSTKLIFEKIVLDSGIKDNLFHEKNLKRIPK
jgi:hypothetical protein